MFVVLVASYVVGAEMFTCPLPEDISPCSCSSDEYDETGNGALLDCTKKNLTNAMTSKILRAYHSTPKVTPLTNLQLFGNQLTRIPDEIKLFHQLRDLSFQLNQITTIHAGAFKFSRPVGLLQIDNMQVMNIEPGAFQGTLLAYKCIYKWNKHINSIATGSYGNGSRIMLYFNKINRLESAVFKSVLEQMAPYGGVCNAYIYPAESMLLASHCSVGLT